MVVNSHLRFDGSCGDDDYDHHDHVHEHHDHNNDHDKIQYI